MTEDELTGLCAIVDVAIGRDGMTMSQVDAARTALRKIVDFASKSPSRLHMLERALREAEKTFTEIARQDRDRGFGSLENVQKAARESAEALHKLLEKENEWNCKWCHPDRVCWSWKWDEYGPLESALKCPGMSLCDRPEKESK